MPPPNARLVTPAGATLLLGGARCGKSALAVELAIAWGGAVTFVATAERGHDGAEDPDLAARIARHRAERPASWTTVETSRDVPAAVSGASRTDLVLVDCVSLWVARLLVDGLDEDGAIGVADALLDALATRSTPTLLVTNEVGMGVHPSTPAGRAYRDVLGRVNRRLAERAAQAVLVVAGGCLPLRPPTEIFG
jgi:adenosyl cobinamide kinase/adenosyl cobinamide phosphate guanylyltransferase